MSMIKSKKVQEGRIWKELFGEDILDEIGRNSEKSHFWRNCRNKQAYLTTLIFKECTSVERHRKEIEY